MVERAGGEVGDDGDFFQTFYRRISRDAFAKLLMAEIRAAGQSRSMSYDAEAYCLRFDGADDFLNLSNAYLAYSRAARRDRPAVLRQYAALPFVPCGSSGSYVQGETKGTRAFIAPCSFFRRVSRHFP